MMKKSILLLMLAVFICSCASGPETAVKNFTESLAQGKVTEAKKYGTESAGKMLDMLSVFGGIPAEPDFKFEMIKDSVVDSKAWVTYKNAKGKEETVEVVKIDGEWLVHIDSKK